MVYMYRDRKSQCEEMGAVYPTPADVGIKIPHHLREDRFYAGFEHGLRGGQLDRLEFLKLSFREGFRAAKIYLRAVRKERGIIEFPMRARVRMRVA